MKETLLSTKQFREALGGISTTTLWRYTKSGLIPKPLKPSPSQNFWKASWVDDFISKMEKSQEVA